MALSARLADCEHRLALRSTTPARDYADNTSGEFESSPPPGVTLDCATALDDMTATGVALLAELMVPIERALCALEEALDYDAGFAPARRAAVMLGIEKDAELEQHWRGVHPETVSAHAPYLGSPRTVQLARRRLGLDPVTGC